MSEEKNQLVNEPPNVSIDPVVEPPNIALPISGTKTTVCVPCQKKAYTGIANDICNSMEQTGNTPVGKCSMLKDDVDNGKISLKDYTQELINMAPDQQKQALQVLMDVGNEKNLLDDG